MQAGQNQQALAEPSRLILVTYTTPHQLPDKPGCSVDNEKPGVFWLWMGLIPLMVTPARYFARYSLGTSEELVEQVT